MFFFHQIKVSNFERVWRGMAVCRDTTNINVWASCILHQNEANQNGVRIQIFVLRRNFVYNLFHLTTVVIFVPFRKKVLPWEKGCTFASNRLWNLSITLDDMEEKARKDELPDELELAASKVGKNGELSRIKTFLLLLE